MPKNTTLNNGISIPIKQLEDRMNMLITKNYEQTSDYTKGIVSGEYDFIRYLLGLQKPYFISLPKLDITKNTLQTKGNSSWLNISNMVGFRLSLMEPLKNGFGKITFYS